MVESEIYNAFKNGERITTRDGVEVVWMHLITEVTVGYPLIVVMKDNENPRSYTHDGRYWKDIRGETPMDLVLPPRIVTGWVPVWFVAGEPKISSYAVYSTKEESMAANPHYRGQHVEITMKLPRSSS